MLVMDMLGMVIILGTVIRLGMVIMLVGTVGMSTMHITRLTIVNITMGSY